MRNGIGWGKHYPRIAWPNNARLAVSLVVCFEEGAERTPLEGDDRSEAADLESSTEGAVTESKRRDLQVESLWEYGSRRGIWRLLDIFDRHAVTVTFFCAGQALERNPQAAKEIVARGHEIGAHGYRHIPHACLDATQVESEILRAVAAIEGLTGQRPVGWYSRDPSVHTRSLLMKHGGFLYDSDSYDDDLPHFQSVDGKRLLTIPCNPELNDGRFWSAPGLSGFTSPDDFFDIMRESFHRLYREGVNYPQMMSIALHPRNSGRPSRAGVVAQFLRYVRGFPDVWFARRIDIAQHWLANYGEL